MVDGLSIVVEYEALRRRQLNPGEVVQIGQNFCTELLLFTELDTHFTESGLRKDDLKHSEKSKE